MALGVLMILFIVLIIVAITIQILLYIGENKSKNSIFIINMIFGILLSYLVFTSLPINYSSQRILAITLGVISILAMVIKLKSQKYILVSRVMLSVAIISSLVQLFF